LLIKRPDFEESKVISLVKNPDMEGVGLSFNGDMQVGVRYHGRKVYLLVKERLRRGEYRGQIIGFSPGSETCEELTMGEEVIFRASHVCWISK
jgi:hypothetical protein